MCLPIPLRQISPEEAKRLRDDQAEREEAEKASWDRRIHLLRALGAKRFARVLKFIGRENYDTIAGFLVFCIAAGVGMLLMSAPLMLFVRIILGD